MGWIGKRRPAPATVISVIALMVALGGTGYAAQRIHGGAIKKQTIGGGKLKKNTLTGFQIRENKLGEVKRAKRASHTYWAVVHNPAGPKNAVMPRASDSGFSVTEAGGFVTVAFPRNVNNCAHLAARNNAGTAVPSAGYAQTRSSPASAGAIEVRTRDAKGANEDADFHLIVICP